MTKGEKIWYTLIC